jgi:hypothetical protein
VLKKRGIKTLVFKLFSWIVLAGETNGYILVKEKNLKPAWESGKCLLDDAYIGRVDVGTNGLNAGRYVGDGIDVGARQNDDGSGGAVVIELEVIDDVILDAETSQFGGSSVGVSWRHDF